MDRELLLNRASCIIPDALGNSKNQFEWITKQFKDGDLYGNEKNFILVLEKAEMKNTIYLGYIKRLETLRKMFYMVPCYIRYKHRKITIPVENRLSEFEFCAGGKYITGKICRVKLDYIDHSIFKLFSNSYYARITLIMIRRFRDSELSIIPKDVVNLIATEVWKTRFDEVWFKKIK